MESVNHWTGVYKLELKQSTIPHDVIMVIRCLFAGIPDKQSLEIICDG